MFTKLTISLFLALSLFSYSGTHSIVNALTEVPSFTSCPNPGGSVIASYPEGNHGIPGDFGTYSGSDTVFKINPTQTVQCFCTANGSGIQTNWWKVGSISQNEIDSLKNLGWNFIPDGSLWGLEPVVYMAKNQSVSCTGGSNGGSSGGSSSSSTPVCDSKTPDAPKLISAVKSGTQATLTWTKVENATHYSIYYGTQPGKWDYSVVNTGNVTSYTIASLDPKNNYYFEVRSVNNCAPSNSSTGIGGGEVLGASTFAPTGTANLLLFTSLLSLSFFGLYLFAKRRQTREI